MAQRYGGAHSPKDPASSNDDPASANKFRGRTVRQSDIRVKLLFLAPIPLLFSAFGELRSGDAFGMAAELTAFVALFFAAYLLRDGIKAQAAFEARTIARPPKIPRKLFAAELSGVGIMLAAFFGWKLGLVPAFVFGVIGSIAHIVSFGLDPMRKKGMEGVNAFDAERVAKAVDKAETLVRETLGAAKRIGDRRLEGRVESLAAAARDMFRAVEEDPRDLSSARKFLSVYLRGARDATIKFADLYAKSQDQSARKEYEALLGDLETSFSQQRKTMLLENRSDLDVEIEVLRDRLKQEGLRAGE